MGHFKPLWALVPAIRPRFGRSKFGTSQVSSRVPPYLDSASGGLGDAHASQSHYPKSHRTGHYERRKESGGKNAVFVFQVLNNEALISFWVKYRSGRQYPAHRFYERPYGSISDVRYALESPYRAMNLS